MPRTYDSIATTTLSSAQATISFNSISNAYTDLVLVVHCVIGTTGNPLYCRFNSDSSTSYSWEHLFGNGTSGISNRSSNATFMYLGETASSTANPTSHILNVMSYSGSTNKSTLLRCARDMNGTGLIQNAAGLWRNTSAINNITIGTFQSGFNLGIGTTATLYGILRA